MKIYILFFSGVFGVNPTKALKYLSHICVHKQLHHRDGFSSPEAATRTHKVGKRL